jgi:vancomycin resistance protein YoaR
MRHQPSPLLNLSIISISAVIIFALAATALLIGFQAFYNGYIYPGVQVGWVDVAGMKTEDAAALLDYHLTYPQRGRILLRDDDKIWVSSPAEVGLSFSSDSNAQLAYEIGRDGTFGQQLAEQFRTWYRGTTLTPVMIFDERQAENYLKGLAAEINRPTVEASLEINGIDVVVQPGQVGRTLDVAAARELIRQQVQTLLDGEIVLPIHEDEPTILDVSEQAELARQILSEPLVIRMPDQAEGDPGPWRFSPEDLASMLTIERVDTPEGATYQVGLDTGDLRQVLTGIAPSLDKQAVNARFIFNDDTHELEVIQPSVTGQSLDIEATIQAVNENLIVGEHKINLDMDYALPEITDDLTAADLGITELIHSEVSYFRGSDTSRVQNIKTASSRFHGLLVAPGETFSMAEVIGDVSLDTGYAEAWIIYGDRTIKGVGGGVCQVSTTLFRTVFFSGFPVIERYPHAYRVYYYEQTYSGHDARLAGLDATVYVPLVDFKFTNDTPYWLLMETYSGDNWLQWKFYSTSDGRSVDWESSGLRNKQDPPTPVYQENPNLAKGEIKQVDWAVEGADVSITRYVYKDGKVFFEDVFDTHYEPWRAVCEYGPGTKGMPPKNISSSNPCRP